VHLVTVPAGRTVWWTRPWKWVRFADVRGVTDLPV